MNIDPNQTLAGIPILQIIAFLRDHHELRWFGEAVEAALLAQEKRSSMN